MPTILVKDTTVCPGSIDVDGSEPLVGDFLEVGMHGSKAGYRGLWRVVERQHRVTGPRCVLAFLFVEPVDEVAKAFAVES